MLKKLFNGTLRPEESVLLKKNLTRGFVNFVRYFFLLALSYGAIWLLRSTPMIVLFALIGGGSLSVIFPFCLLKLAEKVPPET